MNPRTLGKIGSLVLAGWSTLSLAASPYDGVYIGQGKVVSGTCTLPGPGAQWTIKDGQLSSLFLSGSKITPAVSSNGRLSGQGHVFEERGSMITRTLTGQITGNRLEADVVATHCSWHFSLTKH